MGGVYAVHCYIDGHRRTMTLFVSPTFHPMVTQMPLPLTGYITLPIPEFCSVTGLGQTLVREMVKDGRLQAYRAGKKRLLVVVQSYLDLVAKQQAEGVPEYNAPKKAIAARMANHAARRK